jgi:tetratricopeptide (TPR) repeat protein
MNAQTALYQAINAAKESNWAVAIDCNQAILDQNPNDVGALNRMAVAYLQLKDAKKAKAMFKQVLQIDKSNPIAKKNLARLENNQAAVVPTFSREDFIEEPGKTKTVELHRLAGKNVLDNLAIGLECDLKPKNRYISVEHKGSYIGALPEDISFRLAKLIETGNTYFCCIKSFSSSHVNAYIKELSRSVTNENVHSFPVSKSSVAAINDVDDHLLLEDEIPVQIVDSDSDVEKSLDDLEPEDNSDQN